ncbi:MAG: uracil-DNA glycosylase [Bacillus sp. (in: firmicutes)]
MILPKEIHESWLPFLTPEIKCELQHIEKELGDNYNPSQPKYILRFLTVDLQQVKVIWLGQDVYPMKGVATGRSFEVGGLESWEQPFRQVSLKNIIRLLHKNYHQIDCYEDIQPFTKIKQEIKTGEFPIKPPTQWFSYLEDQGVLFLNTSFTCEVGQPNSHKHIWQAFSQQVLAYISKVNPSIIWFLWGKEAKENKAYIKEGIFYESRHPMMCSAKYEDDFLKFDGFDATKHVISWIGN